MGNDNPIVIADAVRSAVGKAHKGTLALKRPDELGGDVVRALLARNPQVKPEMVDDIKIGCAMPEGDQGLNVARLIGLLADIPQEASAVTVNRFCSSGLQAIADAAGCGRHWLVRRCCRWRRRIHDVGTNDRLSPERLSRAYGQNAFGTHANGHYGRERRQQIRNLSRGSKTPLHCRAK